MKNRIDKKRYGHHESGHAALAFIVVIGLVGLLGFVAYSSWQKKLADAAGTSSLGQQRYFQKKDNMRLDGTRVFQLVPPPRSDKLAENYAYWPATDFSSGNAKAVNDSTWTGGDSWYFQWANRTNYGTAWNKKPNPTPSPAIRLGKDSAGKDIECRLTYTSIARANAATRSQIRYTLGMTREQYMQPWLLLPGTSEADFVNDDTFRASPTSYCTTAFNWNGWQGNLNYMVATDKVLLPALRMSKTSQTGIVLDYEVQDSRKPETTQAFIKGVAADVHRMGKKLMVISNPLNAPTQKYTSLTAGNLPAILDDVDYLSLMLWSKNREGSIPKSYDNQIKLLGKLEKGEYKKLVLYFELGVPGTTLDDARWVYKKLHDTDERHPSAIMFWRNGAVQGELGPTFTNQKMSLALFNSIK